MTCGSWSSGPTPLAFIANKRATGRTKDLGDIESLDEPV